VPTTEKWEWERFLKFFRRAWKAGDHVAILGPAGGGKTFLASEILDVRKYIVVLDIKGLRDPSIYRLVEEKGFEPITTWPMKDEAKRLKPDRDTGRINPIRVVLSPPNNRPEDLYAMANTFRNVLRDVYIRGGWSVYADELRLITDPVSGMGLNREVENIILIKRFEGCSIIGSSQAPRWIPHAMYDQSVHTFFFRNRDEQVVKRLAEIAGGTDRKEVADKVRSLRNRELLYVSGRTQRMVITKVVPSGPHI
jgi:hypothetical protein